MGKTSTLDAKRVHQLTADLENDIQTQLQSKKVVRRFWMQLRDMVVYLAFLGVFTAICLLSRDSLYAYRYNDLMKDLMLNEEFPNPTVYKMFFDVHKIDEFWEYTSTVMMPQIFKDVGGFGAQYLYGQNVLVGSVRFRQLRVSPGKDCAPLGPFDRIFSDSQCWPRYKVAPTYHTYSTEPYGPNNTFVYRSPDDLGSGLQIAKLQVYHGGGYAEDFPLSVSLADHIAHVQRLRADGWIDLATRVVFVDFTTYNANINMFAIDEMAFEFMPSGGILPSATFRVAKLIKYTRGVDGMTQFTLEIVLLIFVLGYFVSEVLELHQLGLWAYARGGWNLMDLVNLLLFFAAGCVRAATMRIYAEIHLNPADAFRSARFYNFQSISVLNTSELNILATNALLLFFKTYKYADFLPSFAVITATVSRSIRNSFVFVVTVIIVIFGFSQSGVLIWGNDLEGFRTFIDSFYSLLRILLGDFDFAPMKRSNRLMGPLYFVFFVVLVVFILLNMFLAILDEAFGDVQDEHKRHAAANISIVDVVRGWLRRKRSAVSKIRLRLAAAAETEAVIQAADMNADDVLDMAELREIFNRYRVVAADVMGIGSVEELMAMFDMDHNNVLDADEQARLLAELERWSLQADAAKRARSATEKGTGELLDRASFHHKGAKIPAEHAQFVSNLKVDLAMYFKHLLEMEQQMLLVASRMGIDVDDEISLSSA
eukprot:c17658_g1_i1.p1 GENE.c17658_g1_i1~~c17658_g1_i1.p1  ORF type:complete len:710 (-),score=173.25 c17658_g1_i1:21-2150(-)